LAQGLLFPGAMAEIKPEWPRRSVAPQPKAAPGPAIHYARLVMHRKWLVVAVTLAVSSVTIIIAHHPPDIYSAETLILVDPQKVPETYVKSTVTGDIRNRLSTLSQQVLSATRLQKIIDSFDLYARERKTKAREEILAEMRRDIHTSVATDFGGGQDLQAFRISYRGRDPRVVAQVTNQLASLFIEENLKAREELATGTTEFLSSQLRETRKVLEKQEASLRDFKLKHLGEMPEQQMAGLQILGQLQGQLQAVNESLARDEQQRSLTQSMMAQTAAVVDIDASVAPPKIVEGKNPVQRAPQTPLEADRARLKALLARGYKEVHPDVQRVRAEIAAEEAKAALEPAAVVQATDAPAVVQASDGSAPAPDPAPAAEAKREKGPPPITHNPVLEAQIESLDAEIAKERAEQNRLSASVEAYQAKVEAVPVREQEIADLQRDYEMSKAHYAQVLDKQLSAEMATELEMRQKGEKFTVLDPAVPADRPSAPNRKLIDSAGAVAGLCLGLLAALGTEWFGTTIIDVSEVTVAPVLEVIPVIRTSRDREIWKRRWLFAVFSAAFGTAIAAFIYLLQGRALRL
jgi:polysaccharide biosynthesis transport protein